jgi:hypothetical protein
MREENSTIRLEVAQEEADKGFISHLVLGKPTNVRLAHDESAVFNFKLDNPVTADAPLTLTL